MLLVACVARVDTLRSMSAADLTQAVFSLPVAQRIALADRLYASVPAEWQSEADRGWLDEAVARSAEMDADPSLEMSFEDFKKGVQTSQPHG
jgi:Putative addiction module component